MKTKDYFLTKEEFELRPTETEGVLKTFPVPNNINKYYNSKNYISHHQDNNTLKERIYKFFQSINLNYKVNLIENKNTSQLSVLDYGCGAGEFIKRLEHKHQTFGFEPNPDALKNAKLKTNHTIFVDRISDLTNESLDVITLWHVFEHIAEPEKILDEFYKKLRPGGNLIIAVPNFTSYDGKVYKEFWAAYDVPRHLFHYSRNGMLNFFKSKNWKIRKIRPLLLDAFYISILSEKYKKSPLFWLKGAVQGLISNVKASKTDEFSSLIYIIEKK